MQKHDATSSICFGEQLIYKKTEKTESILANILGTKFFPV